MTYSLLKFKRLVPSFIKNLLKNLLRYLEEKRRNRTITKTIDNITYCLDLREAIDYEIYQNRCFEPSTTRAIKKLTKPGMVVLDIGANIGCHTLRLAKLVGLEGKVIAFEPMSWAFKKLKKNITLNNFNNIITEKIALSDKTQNNTEIEFACSWPINAQKSELHPIHKGKIMKDSANMETLDNYTNKNQIKKIDLIKLDTDGFELKILKGGLFSIRKYHPIIITEIGKYTLEEQGDHPEKMIDLLLNEKYRLCSESNLKPFSDKTSLLNSIPNKKTINIIAFPL